MEFNGVYLTKDVIFSFLKFLDFSDVSSFKLTCKTARNLVFPILEDMSRLLVHVYSNDVKTSSVVLFFSPTKLCGTLFFRKRVCFSFCFGGTLEYEFLAMGKWRQQDEESILCTFSVNFSRMVAGGGRVAWTTKGWPVPLSEREQLKWHKKRTEIEFAKLLDGGGQQLFVDCNNSGVYEHLLAHVAEGVAYFSSSNISMNKVNLDAVSALSIVRFGEQSLPFVGRLKKAFTERIFEDWYDESEAEFGNMFCSGGRDVLRYLLRKLSYRDLLSFSKTCKKARRASFPLLDQHEKVKVYQCDSATVYLFLKSSSHGTVFFRSS